MKRRLITVIFRLPFNFNTHTSLAIMEESGYNIEELSQDVYRCYRNINNKKIYQQCLLEDLHFLNDMFCLEFPKEQIDEDFQVLFKALDGFESSIQFEPHVKVKLIRLELEKPDSAYFHFVEA